MKKELIKNSEILPIAQGDVLLKIAIDSILVNAIPVEAEDGLCILAHGEQTGHRHVIPATDATIYFCNDNNKRYLNVIKCTLLTHEEHDPIEIEEGIYEIIQQREHDDELEWRTVAD